MLKRIFESACFIGLSISSLFGMWMGVLLLVFVVFEPDGSMSPKLALLSGLAAGLLWLPIWAHLMTMHINFTNKE